MSSYATRSSSMLNYAFLVLFLLLVISGIFYYTNSPDKFKALFVITSLLSIYIVISISSILLLRKYRQKTQAEKELRKLSRAVEQNPASIVITDLKGNIEYVNPKFIELTGYSLQEALGNNPRILKSGLTPPETYTSMWDTISKGNSWSGEYCNRKKNGELYWEYAIISPIMDETGTITNFIAIKEDITELRLADEARRESEERISALINSVDESIWLFSIDGTILIANKIAAQRLNRKAVEVIEKKWYNIIPDEIKKNTQDIINQVLQTRQAVRFEAQQSGSTYDHNFYPVFNSKGDVTSITVFSRDVTERVNQQAALIESERRFRQLADSMPQLVWTAEPDGNVDYYNSRSSELEGISQVETGKWKWEPVVHPDDVEATIQAWNYAISSGTFYEIAHRIRLKTGIFKWFLSRGIPIKDDKGKTIKWYGTATDIHLQKAIEEKLNQTLSQLALSESKLKEAQKLAHTGSFLIDLNTYRVEGSDELYRILEINKELQLNVNNLLKNLYEEDRMSVYKLINLEVKAAMGIESEFRYNTPIGLKYIKIISKPMVENGSVTKLFGTAIDVTEQKKQEQKLQVLLAELTRSNKDLEQFAYTSSHDLQEPIRMIKSYAQLLELKHRDSLDNNAKEYLNFIIEGASRMQQLVNDLLNYSRVTTNKQELELVDLNIILGSVLKDLKLRITEEKAIVSVESLPHVRGDKTQLRQLFQNFIQNALKFRSDRNPEITIKCAKRKHDWQFSISDNGIGIDPQFYEKIFIIFQRLHDREKYSGTGVGLAICKKIVERHGGEIFVESEVNKGTTFYFSLPF